MTVKFCHLLLIFIFFKYVSGSDNIYLNAHSIKIIKDDSPTFLDLMVFIPSLNRILDFCEQNRNMLSINLVHGLFLLDVNLGPFARDDDIPESLRADLKNMLTRSDKLQIEYKNSSKGGKLKNLLSALASNATSWSKRLQKLNYDLLEKTYARGKYPKWHRYLSTIEAIDKGTPSPSQSDKCVTSLVGSEENFSEDLSWRCALPDECYQTIVNGTDFGYWLTHRLILLLHGRLSRNCAIFSVQEDQLYRTEFCEKAYREAEYIALNGFEIVDLFLEQIAICALDGNAQFLRRSWLIRALEYQQPGGCFQLYKLRPIYKPKTKNCDGHAMAVALATYSAAIRLILENLKRFD